MEFKPGSRWRSAVGSAEFVVVRPPRTAGVLRSGGQNLLVIDAPVADGATLDPALADALAIGKRYTDSESGIELLVSKAGVGTLTFDDRTLVLKEAKQLPSSD